jgi:hypothetical protein
MSLSWALTVHREATEYPFRSFPETSHTFRVISALAEANTIRSLLEPIQTAPTESVWPGREAIKLKEPLMLFHRQTELSRDPETIQSSTVATERIEAEWPARDSQTRDSNDGNTRRTASLLQTTSASLWRNATSVTSSRSPGIDEASSRLGEEKVRI